MEQPPVDTGPLHSNLAAWMENLNLSPGAALAYPPPHPPAPVVPQPHSGYLDWQPRGLSPVAVPGYGLPPAQPELFMAQDQLAAAPRYHPESVQEGEEGEGEFDGCGEGEGKTRSKMQEKNRRAQKRFRERQKTKFTELTSKVEQLEARLASALVEKAKSEDRASILEKCLELRCSLPVAASSSAVLGEGCSSDTAAAAATASAATAAARAGSRPGVKDDVFTDSVVPLTLFHDEIELSLPLGGVQRLTPGAFKMMSPRDVIELYESYVEAMRVCLEEESVEEDSSPAGLRLARLVHEITSVLARAAALNPVTMRHMHQHVNPPTPEGLQENINISRHLAPLLHLSAAQAQKLVAVTAQYRQQTAVLVAQRCELYKGMRTPAPTRPNACTEELIRDFLLAHQDMDVLKSNLRQEHWEVLNWITKCYEVTTPVQTARFMLGSHPRWFDYLSLSMVVADELGLRQR